MAAQNGSQYDPLVEGGGHKGLTCAGYLARSGLRVLVLERRPIGGGAAGSSAAWSRPCGGCSARMAG